MRLAVGLGLALVCVGGVYCLLGTRAARHDAAEAAQSAAPAAGAAPLRDAMQVGADAAPTELAAARARIAELEAQVAQLRATIDAAEESRVAREREFLRFTQGISHLGTLAGATMPTFETKVPAAAAGASSAGGNALPDAKTAAQPATSPEADAAAALQADANAVRSRAIFLALRALLAAEQVQGLDLLESGNLQGGFTGPVVLRELDERGRPMGSLTADRLHLEASRAARMVTIVLEQGCERRDGARTPFDGGPADAEGRGGQRRIVLADCDPRQWIEALPELFPEKDREPLVDDGRVDVGRLRATLNTLLLSDVGASRETGTGARPATGWYRLQGLGGVQGVVLRDIALDQLDRDGRPERRFFADRMVILRESQGLQIQLEGGSQVRGDQKTPFLDGRYRIFLPRADMAAWEKAGIPGLVGVAPATVQPAVVPVSPAPAATEPAEPRKP